MIKKFYSELLKIVRLVKVKVHFGKKYFMCWSNRYEIEIKVYYKCRHFYTCENFCEELSLLVFAMKPIQHF